MILLFLDVAALLFLLLLGLLIFSLFFSLIPIINSLANNHFRPDSDISREKSPWYRNDVNKLTQGVTATGDTTDSQSVVV
jgi:hypothetical protein